MDCFYTSWRQEGPIFLIRGIGSTVLHSCMTVASFGAYSFITKKYRTNKIEDSYHTIDDIKTNSIKEDKELSTVTTDGPNVLSVQESSISDSYFARIYPEQMLFACTYALENKIENALDKFQISRFSNHNQFTQMCLSSQDSQNKILEIVSTRHEEYLPPKYYYSSEDRERLRSCITSEDFLLPSNLLSKKSNKDRIYGFYYLVV